MQYDILHDVPGRLRVKCRNIHMSKESADAIGSLLSLQEGIRSAELSLRTGNLLIHHSHLIPKKHVTDLLDVLDPSDWEDLPFDLLEELPSFLEMSTAAAVKTVYITILKLLFLPKFIRHAIILRDTLPLVAKGLASLKQRRLDIAVLDATSLSILAVRGNFRTMRTILWMLSAADSFSEWTRGQSRLSLAESLDLKIDTVWIKVGAIEKECPMLDVKPGDLLIARTGGVIPIDGVVIEGEALVNQSVLTGESEAVRKAVGLSVFAGSLVDEGEITIRVESTEGETRLQGIIKFIEESDALKGEIQSRGERMANVLVPCNFLLAFLTLAFTRNPLQASAVLMIDYSCATRLATPLTILNTIMEGVKNNILIKGGKHIEAMAQANSLVVDKTGTLTRSKASVSRVFSFNGWREDEVLRTAACIEEHFPHPMGRAVIKKAQALGLHHGEQCHSKPEYIPAHGILSTIDGKQVAIGSAHFLFEDLRIPFVTEVEKKAEKKSVKGRSLLYMAYDGQIVGMLAIVDPIRPDAAATLLKLSQNGVQRITMLTGDGTRTAKAVANELGITSYHSGLLPVDKAKLIQKMQLCGDKVMFVGDGVNDSPAISASDVGVSLQDGSAVAKELAGVVLLDGKLERLVTARQLSTRALERINRQFIFIVILNSMLGALGLFGHISPRAAALLHNCGTMLVTANSIRRLLPEEKNIPVEKNPHTV